MSETNAWENILDPGESIVWQGRPVPGFEFRFTTLVPIAFGAIFASFSVYWMWIASMGSVIFALFGLPFLFVGLGIIASGTVWPPFIQSRTWYTLTDRRGIIATRPPFVGQKLKTYSFRNTTSLELVENGQLASVYFAQEIRRGKDNDYTVDIGFERIESGREVYRLLRDMRTAPEIESSDQ